MQTKYKKLIILLILFTITLTLSACSNSLEKSLKNNFYQLEGKIVDNDGNGISNVTIKSEGGNEVVKSNSDGSYQISVPKDGVKIELVKKGYSFFNNNFEVNKDMKKNIIAYPDKSSNLINQFLSMRNQISQIIADTYDLNNHQKTIKEIEEKIRESKLTITSFNYTSNSITVKFYQGGKETWLLNSNNIILSDDEEQNLSNSFSLNKTTLNNTVTPNSQKALIINSHYNNNSNNSTRIANELNDMGYDIEIVSGTNVSENIYKEIDKYGIVYIQSYSNKYNDNTMIMTGKKVENDFYNISDELYELYMTKNASPIAIPENNTYPNYYWGINNNIISDNFTTNNNTIIFSASAGLLKDNNFVNNLLANGASTFVSTNNTDINSQAIYDLIKEMRQHTELNKAHENLDLNYRQNITIRKANTNEDIYISTDIDNEPPNLDTIGNKTINENNTLSFKVNASDPDDDDSKLVYEASGELSKHFNPNTQSFNWTPTYNDGGKYELIISVSDGTYSNSETITIEVIDQAKTGTAKWKYNNKGNNTAIYNTPALNDYSTSHIYSNGYLLGRNEDGSQKLAVNISGGENKDFQSSVVINKYGDFYYAKDKLYAYSSGGTLKWTFDDGYSFYSQPALDENGNIYIVGYDENKNSKLYKIKDNNYNSDLKWSSNLLNGSVKSNPVVSKDNKIYVADNKGYLYAFLSEGIKNKKEAIKIWEYKAKGGFVASPIIGSNGTIYIGDQSKAFYALSPDGKEKGYVYLTSAIDNSAIIDQNGHMYVSTNSGNLYKLDPEQLIGKDNTNSILAKHKISDKALSTPAVADDETIYVNSQDKNLYTIDGSTGNIKWSFETKSSIYSNPTIGNDGTVYLGSTDTYLYAVHTDSSKSANTPWPMYSFDRYNSGRRDYNSSGNPPYIILIPIGNTPEITEDENEIDTMLVNEGQTMELKFAGGDPDGDPVDITLDEVTGLNEDDYDITDDKRFIWKPDHNASNNSPYELNFLANEGEADKSLIVEVIDKNIAPVIEQINGNDTTNLSEYTLGTYSENEVIEFTVSSYDEDGDKIYYNLEGDLSEEFSNDDKTLETFNWTADYDLVSSEEESKDYTLTLVADDRKGENRKDQIDINFTINNNDRAPQIIDVTSENGSNQIADYEFEIDEMKTLILNITAEDPDGDEIEYKVSPTEPFSDIWDDSYLNDGAGEEGQITWTPSPDLQSQDNPQTTYSFYLKAVANGKESTNNPEIKVTVNNNNRPPTIENKTELKNIQPNENGIVSFVVEGTDKDGDELTYEIGDIVDSENESVNSSNYEFIENTGEFNWEKPSTGTYYTTVSASDGEDTSEVVDVVIKVDNNPPNVHTDGKNFFTVDENNELKFFISVDDPEGDEVVDLYTTPGSEFPENELIADHLTSKDSKTNWTFAWTPDYDHGNEDYDITFVGETADGKTSTHSITIGVYDKNGPPSFTTINTYDSDGNETASITEGETIKFKLNFNDPDQNDTLRLIAQLRDEDGDPVEAVDGIPIEDKLLQNEQTEFTKDEYSSDDFSTTLDWETKIGDVKADSKYTVRFIIDDGTKQDVIEVGFRVNPQ